MQRNIPLMAVAAIVSLASCGCSAAHQPPQVPEKGAAGAIAWLNRHSVDYRIPIVYEFGPNDAVRKAPPLGARSPISFDLPTTHTHWRFFGLHGRSALYDTAVAAVFLSLADQPEHARRLLLTAEHLQNPDGSFGFSWNCVGDGFYNRSYRRTGSIAWLGYAAVVYEQRSGDKRFRPMAERTAGYVISQQVTIRTDPRYGLVTGGSGRWAPDYTAFKDEPAEWCGTEHQIDSWWFLRDIGRLTGKADYTRAADLLKQQMFKTLWNEGEGRLMTGISPDGKLDATLALDAATWGALYLHAVGKPDQARRSLAFAERNFKNTACGITGYKAYAGSQPDHPVTDWDRVAMVWSEGSLGAALAYLRLGGADRCRQLVREIAKMEDATGGVRYSAYADDLPLPPGAVQKIDGRNFSDPLADFFRAPSAAGTAWMGLVRWSMEKQSDEFWRPDPPAQPDGPPGGPSR